MTPGTLCALYSKLRPMRHISSGETGQALRSSQALARPSIPYPAISTPQCPPQYGQSRILDLACNNHILTRPSGRGAPEPRFPCLTDRLITGSGERLAWDAGPRGGQGNKAADGPIRKSQGYAARGVARSRGTGANERPPINPAFRWPALTDVGEGRFWGVDQLMRAHHAIMRLPALLVQRVPPGDGRIGSFV